MLGAIRHVLRACAGIDLAPENRELWGTFVRWQKLSHAEETPLDDLASLFDARPATPRADLQLQKICHSVAGDIILTHARSVLKRRLAENKALAKASEVAGQASSALQSLTGLRGQIENK